MRQVFGSLAVQGCPVSCRMKEGKKKKLSSLSTPTISIHPQFKTKIAEIHIQAHATTSTVNKLIRNLLFKNSPFFFPSNCFRLSC